MVFSINPTADKTQAMFKELAIAQNGEGEGTPIVGGPEQPPAEEPPADAPPADAPPAENPPADAPPSEEAPVEEEAPPANGGDNAVVPGNGVVGEDGSCICMVSCTASGFPSLQAQGLGNVGGVPGSIPIRLASVS